LTEHSGHSTTDQRVADGDVLVTRIGRLGRITLNRPRTINALTCEMLGTIEAALIEFAAAEEITTVLIDGAGPRGLCAGGDMRAIVSAIASGEDPRAFFRQEYRLNARIARFSKPVVAFMDGIVMGGGVGLSGHASIRIVTERTTVAMPEVDIGFAPDVGGTWLLARAPGEIGTHAGLTSARLDGADAIFCGLADHSVESETLPALIGAFAERDPHAVVTDLTPSKHLPPSPMARRKPWIDACYASDDVRQIVDRLRSHTAPESHDAADAILRKSPTSVTVTLRALRTARRLGTVEACLTMEYRIASTLLSTPDFTEGVRAVLIDKDHMPGWNPDTLADVSVELVDRCFAPRDDELDLAR
jgi:enoyl-CoA hydratase